MTFWVKALNVIAVSLIATFLTPAQSQEELYQEFMQLNQQLQQIQQQALSDKDIEAMNLDFSDRLEAAMIEEEPEIKSTINKRNQLIEKFEKERDNASQEQLEEIRNEFEEVTQKLQPMQELILQKEEFQSDIHKIENAVMDKMEEINPETPQMLARMNELGLKLQQMQEQTQ
jgi:hypothetical protein